MIQIKDNKVISTENKIIHIIGTDTYGKSFFPARYSLEKYEEVDAMPSEEVITAISNKIKEIQDYDKSNAVNSFSLDGMDVWLDKATRVGLMNSISIEKNQRKINTTLWFAVKGVMHKFEIDIDKAIAMLGALEMYALECYNTTAQHIANVSKLTTAKEIEDYDYTSGYPQKLNLQTKEQ